jgi:hypothetical protein
MTLTIITKNFGTQTIDTEWFAAYKVSPSSTVFKAIEHLFDEWYDDECKHNPDVAPCYNGWGEDEPAIYHKRGAIVDAIEAMIEIVHETNKKVLTSRDLMNMDLEACFQI